MQLKARPGMQSPPPDMQYYMQSMQYMQFMHCMLPVPTPPSLVSTETSRDDRDI